MAKALTRLLLGILKTVELILAVIVLLLTRHGSDNGRFLGWGFWEYQDFQFLVFGIFVSHGFVFFFIVQLIGIAINENIFGQNVVVSLVGSISYFIVGARQVWLYNRRYRFFNALLPFVYSRRRYLSGVAQGGLAIFLALVLIVDFIGTLVFAIVHAVGSNRRR